MLNKAKTLKNYKLNSLDGEIGKAKEFYFDDQNWSIRYLMADTGNWLTGRRVLISPNSIVSICKEEEYISINLTKSKIENSPTLDSHKPVSRQFQEKLNGYFDLPMHCVGQQMVGVCPPDVGAYPLIETKNNKEKVIESTMSDNEWDPHLRSTHKVSGYDIQAMDGKIGHVDDFIIDEETWEIRYLIIDTQNWLPGKKIVLSTQWISCLSWDESKVFVNFLCKDIKQSPEYTEESILNRDYEIRLYEHYNRKGYWQVEQDVKNNSR
ncbi:PRC-barrel domain-containing protein [Clostridium sp.]|uniref:PRC-barrel domain containing protein n=1 Tax=Clostridium sp. TaxID=1506 RepID=UPI003D6CFEA2